MEKIKIKGIILVLLLVLGILGLNTKYQKYRNEKNNEKLLKENKKELEAKIENVISEYAGILISFPSSPLIVYSELNIGVNLSLV